MPRFVPVSNPELSKNEQNLNSEDNIKHRQFDNPHSLIKSTKVVDRGWQQGTLGWGVLGAFGSDAKGMCYSLSFIILLCLIYSLISTFR